MENFKQKNNCILQEVLSDVKCIKRNIEELKSDISIIKKKINEEKIDDEIFTDEKPTESSGWFFS